MSAATFLQALGITNVPRVPPEKAAKVTGKSHINHNSYPCYPCYPEKLRMTEEKREPEPRNHCQAKPPVDPDDLLLEIAKALEASPARLRALLSADDMQDIAEGATSRAHLMAYFSLMRFDGSPVADEQPSPPREPESPTGHVECMKAWKPAHYALINHLMACAACYAPRARYCNTGAELSQAYRCLCYPVPAGKAQA